MSTTMTSTNLKSKRQSPRKDEVKELTPQTTTQPSGLATSSPWNASPYAFAPNTNVMDSRGMTSDNAQAARDKSAEIMAALKEGDMDRANALMGKSEAQGQILPGMGWLKKRINKRSLAKEANKESPHGDVVLAAADDDGVIR